jgi:hypothetical protein
MRDPERFEGLTNWRRDCSSQVEELLGRDAKGKGAKAARSMANVVSEVHEVTGSLIRWQITNASVKRVHFTKGEC